MTFTVFGLIAIAGVAIWQYKPDMLPQVVVEHTAPFEIEQLKKQHAVLALPEAVEDAQRELNSAEADYNFAVMVLGNAKFTAEQFAKADAGNLLKRSSLSVEYSTRLRSALEYVENAKEDLANGKVKYAELKAHLDKIPSLATPQALRLLEEEPQVVAVKRDFQSLSLMITELSSKLEAIEGEVINRLTKGL